MNSEMLSLLTHFTPWKNYTVWCILSMKGMHSYFHVIWMGNHNRYVLVFSRPSSPHIIAERQNILIMIRLYFSSWWHNDQKPGVVLACQKHYYAHSRWIFGPPLPQSRGYDIQLRPSVHTYVLPICVIAISREPVDLFCSYLPLMCPWVGRLLGHQSILVSLRWFSRSRGNYVDFCFINLVYAISHEPVDQFSSYLAPTYECGRGQSHASDSYLFV